MHVDHGLRESSADEAERARALARSHGHELTLLTWVPGTAVSGLQEKARQARYGLMGDYCRQHGIETLVTGHHADDQAETVLMRLKRGTGWRGAAGMRARRYAPVWPELAGVTLVRPALNLSRADLRSELGDQVPVQDPSNANRDFARIRVRDELARHPGLKADMLTLSADMTAGLSEELHRMRGELRGYTLSHDGVFSVPRLIGPQALALIAPIIGGQSGQADLTRITRKIAPLRAGKTVSIGEGCVGHWDGEILTLSRDRVAVTGRSDRRLSPTAVPMAISPDPFVWDGRFLVSGEAGQIHPTDRDYHVGYRIHYGRRVTVRNLVRDRLDALLTAM